MHRDNFRAKCIYVAVMLRRMIDAFLNKDSMDDKVIISIPKISELSLLWVGKHGYYTLARIIKSPIGGLMV